MNPLLSAGVVVALSGVVTVTHASATDALDFFKGRQITVIVASDAAGLAGQYGRVVGEAVVKHLPGGAVPVVQFMPGGGGRNGANYCYNVAPKDGSTICQLSPSVPTAQLIEKAGVRYDAAKFNWIGQSADQNGALAIWHSSPVKTFEDTRKGEVILGATGKSSETFIDPTIFNAVLGTKFKLVLGYRSAGDLNVAMERGEIHGYNGPMLTYLSVSKQLVADGKIRLISQMGLRKQPQFQNVPLAAEFARDADSKTLIEFVAARAQVGRAFVAPPNVPADRVAVLRAAFDATMKDPAFLKAAAKIGFEINPASGAEVEKIVSRILSTPDAVVRRAAAILAN